MKIRNCKWKFKFSAHPYLVAVEDVMLPQVLSV